MRRISSLPNRLKSAYIRDDEGKFLIEDGEYVPDEDMGALIAMLLVMVLHGGPPESLAKNLAPDRAQPLSQPQAGTPHA
jgi:hypothetical protein